MALPKFVDDFDRNLPENELRMRFYHYRDTDIKSVDTGLSDCPNDDMLQWDVLHFIRKDFEPAFQPRFARYVFRKFYLS